MSAEAIVFSDLHFGDPRSLLHSSSQLEKLLLIARQHKPIRLRRAVGRHPRSADRHWSLAIEGMPLGTGGRRSAGFRRFLNELVTQVEAKYIPSFPETMTIACSTTCRSTRYLMGAACYRQTASWQAELLPALFVTFLRASGLGSSLLEVTYPHLELRLGDHHWFGSRHYLDASQDLESDAHRAFRE